jgi:hypothetical protein
MVPNQSWSQLSAVKRIAPNFFLEHWASRFFISRAGKDKVAAQFIADIIREAGLTPFLQDADFGGADFMRKMEEGYKAKRMISLLTSEYQKSEACRKDRPILSSG